MRGDEMSKPNFFEDIEVGSVEEFGSYEVSAQEIIEFATKYDPQPFHLSEEGGKQTHFGGLVASGWHTGSIAMRLICDNCRNSLPHWVRRASMSCAGENGLSRRCTPGSEYHNGEESLQVKTRNGLRLHPCLLYTSDAADE